MDDIEQEATSILLDYVPKDKDSKIFVVLGASVRLQIVYYRNKPLVVYIDVVEISLLGCAFVPPLLS